MPIIGFIMGIPIMGFIMGIPIIGMPIIGIPMPIGIIPGIWPIR